MAMTSGTTISSAIAEHDLDTNHDIDRANALVVDSHLAFIQDVSWKLRYCESGQCTLPGMMHQVLGTQTPGLWMGGWGLLGGPAADSVSDMA